MKELSCGVVIKTSDNHLLACKPFGRFDGRHDIPKGHIESGETELTAAIREVYEETGIDLSDKLLIDKGRFKYIKHKDLHVFLCELDTINISTLRCNSYFELKNGKFVPEMIGYKLVRISDISTEYYISLVPIINEILNLKH